MQTKTQYNECLKQSGGLCEECMKNQNEKENEHRFPMSRRSYNYYKKHFLPKESKEEKLNPVIQPDEVASWRTESDYGNRD